MFDTLAQRLERAFWDAGEATREDDTVHFAPYVDEEMDMVDASGYGMPEEYWQHMATAWTALHTIETPQQLDAVPRGAIIRSSSGTIACRYDALNKNDIERRRPGLSCTLCGDCLKSCRDGFIEYRAPKLAPETARRVFLVLVIALHSCGLALARI